MASGIDHAVQPPPAMIEQATSIADWVLIWPVALPLFAAAALLMFRRQTAFQAPLSFMVLFALLVNAWILLDRVANDGPVAMTMGKWVPPFGISFTADLLSALLSAVAILVTIIVLAYAQGEVEPRDTRYGYHPLVLLLLAGVNGAFLTGDIFNLYVWFEVMLIASFGLFILGGRKTQLDGAVKYGFINFLATTFFLIGIAYLYGLTGTLNMADIALKSSAIEYGPRTTVVIIFVLAFAIKAAAFPLNAWLAASYHTPNPSVSALFAGLLTKVGVYALIRILFVLVPAAWTQTDTIITVIAGATLVVAPLGAIAETNLRRALGFILVGGIGAMLAGLALADPTQNLSRGIFGTAFYAAHSMLTMTALYLVAGLVERNTGELDTRRMGGIYETNSWLSILFLVLVLAVSGLPPFLGFWPKFVLVQSGVETNQYWLVAAVLINAFLTTIAGSRLWAHIFWRSGHEGTGSETLNDRLHPLAGRVVTWGLVPVTVLTAIVFALGLYPGPLFDLGQGAAVDIVTPDRYIDSVGLAISTGAGQ
jgi:multicomponent Na+:H+ antiporter subunit D